MELDDIFRDKLQNREEMPTDHVWAKLSKMLDEQDEVKVIPLVPVAQKATSWRVMYGAVASVLFLVAMLGVWYAGRQDSNSPVAKTEKNNKVGKPNTTDRAESVERLASHDAHDTKDKTTNAIEKAIENIENLTDPDPKNAKTEPTPAKTNPPASQKTNLPTQTKPQQEKNKTSPTPQKPKTFRPIPTRGELIATEYEIKFKKIRIEFEGYVPFEEAVVTISDNEPPVLPVGKKKRKKPRRYFYAKDEQQPKRKFKLFGITRDKMIAFIED